MARPLGSKNSYYVPRPSGRDAYHWKGGRRITATGYVQIFLGSTEPRYRFEHDLIVERAIGHALPTVVEVHHFDEIKTNNAHGNLVVCPDHGYHAELHRKRAVQKAGGNPWTDRLCCMCHVPRPATTFYRQRSAAGPWNPGGYSSVCASCGRARQAARRRRLAA